MKAALQNFHQELIAGSRLEIELAAGGGPLVGTEAESDQIRACALHKEYRLGFTRGIPPFLWRTQGLKA